ncbi:MAG: homoserine dehydrogenase [Algisphaera sp.]
MTQSAPVPAASFTVSMIGYGTVGRGVATLLRDHADLYTARTGRAVRLGRVLVRDVAKARAAAQEAGDPDAASRFTDDAAVFLEASADAVIEVAGGLDPVDGLMREALSAGRHVVTANKALLAARGPALFALAREQGVSIAFEASCGGGIPCVTALTAGLMANDVTALYGILNGTCNYILTEMTQRGKSYAQALAEAKEKGYAEADETLDVSGADAGQKLAILASLAFGRQINGDDVPCRGIDTLDQMDVAFGAEMGYDVKLIAAAERWQGHEEIGLSVAPCFIAKDQPLAQIHGSLNALAVEGDAVGPTLFVGAGAGQLPTASAVVGDLLNMVNGSYPAYFAAMRLTPDLHPSAVRVKEDDLEGRWYVRLAAEDKPGVMAKVTDAFGRREISLSALLQHDAREGESTVPVVVTTHRATRGDVQAAANEIKALDAIAGEPVLMRVL